MNLDRIRLIRKLQQDMLHFIYAHQRKIVAEKMFMFAIMNQNRLGCNSNTFIHDGVWYSAGDPIIKSSDYTPNRVLHPDLKFEVIRLLQQEYDSVMQQGTLQVHFGQVLITARRKEDLRELLPYPLHAMIDLVDEEVFNDGSPLTPDEINEFKKQNHDSITCLNSMLLLELLLSK